MIDGKQVKVVILETSDIHGNILPINYANNSFIEQGLAKLSTLIQKERNSCPNTILVDNGDVIQGTPLTYYYAKIDSNSENPTIAVLNYLQYDCAVIGNHEFNYGKDILEKAVKESKFPWLSANTVNEEDSETLFGTPYIIKEFEGIRIGILGLITNYVPHWENPKHIENIKFENVLKSAEKWVEVLKHKERVDFIILSYHGGFERSLETGEPTEKLTGENVGYELCTRLKNIDVLLTGHQHRAISGKFINGVLVLQPSFSGKYLGRVEVQFEYRNNKWNVVSKNSYLVSAEGAEVDENIVNMVKRAEDRTQEWLDKPIGKVKGDMTVLDPMELRIKDNPLIEFINRVQMESSSADISNTALFDNSAPGFPSNVTMRDIVTNYIYPNTLKVLRVSGKDIKDALEKSASYFAKYDGESIKINSSFFKGKPQHYNYDMWEGIHYIINISKPIGERVIKLQYKGIPIEMDESYEVVMNNYRAGGGGDYLMFHGKEVIKEINVDMAELIANYILERKVIEAEVDYNWEIVHD